MKFKIFLLCSSLVLSTFLVLFDALFLNNSFLNSGISFNLFAFRMALAIPLFFLILLCVYFFCLSDRLLLFGIFLVLSGGFANLIERFLFGGVIDYAAFYNFFTFNLPDMFIFLGLIVFLSRTVGKNKNTLRNP